MKKIYFILIIFSGLQVTLAQRAPLEEIERNLVALEIFTGTWCQYCPGAAMGADDLINNGYPVAVIEHHISDDYMNEYSSTRRDFYGINSYPNAFFDGIVQSPSGSTNQSLFPVYFPLVEQRMEVLTPFSLDFSFNNNGNNEYSITAGISKIGDYNSDVTLHIFVTESHIPEEWQDLSELNFVNRLMYPDANGTALDFSNSDDLIIEHTLSLDPDWDVEYCDFVIFIQDMETKEIFNTAKAPVLQPAYENEVGIKKLLAPGSHICESTIQPEINIKNYGSNLLQSLDIEYSVNNDFVFQYQWEGELGFLSSEDVLLPEIPVNLENGIHEFEVRILNPNGQEDGDDENNEKSIEFEYLSAGSSIYMEAFLGSNAEDLSWELLDPDGNIIAQDNYNENNSGTFIEESFVLESLGCHELIWYDSNGNGFNGDGWCRLYSGSTEFYYFESFEDEYSILWDAYGSEYLMYPTNASGIRTGNEILFEWTAPSKATLLGYNLYQWPDLYNPVNGEMIEEEGYSLTTNENTDLVFFVSALYEEGESDMSKAILVVFPVGLDENISNGDFGFYPNPIEKPYMYLHYPSGFEYGLIELYNLNGQLVFSKQINHKNSKINIKHLIDGMYIANIKDYLNGYSKIYKLIIN